ncbi:MULTISPECIES: hypothetical protein [unclassified Streptomyces]|uniref:Uncharacterized protein n=1 Tax=Streptomyces evansiae TaxID=3075535 RepID=A0ABU2QYS3_9ACTN|nr:MULTISPECIES: hypothetical protein [unclassified Streptomyces]MYQ56747.1 hypothetical protein [Streptomyces sp. SID4926]MYX21734.1 hypothetical protein [Streptomyces sp. SID8380]ASY34458.1 hypothetical protein CAC01_18795 [Streptomyces sp. CLI2509]MDT0409237.1 hypothetical protein [Streptomyces sp. DSM 41979]NJA60738.1 hypothetical protein [Streptomyces sp. NEAU-H3]
MPGIDECLLDAMRLPGARGAGVVDWISGLALGTIGESPNGDHEATAAEAAELARMAAEHRAFAATTQVPVPDVAGGRAGRGHHVGQVDQLLPVEDVIVTNRDSYHIIRFVRTTFDSSVFMHLWLDRDEGNLALARIRIGEIAERLVL